MAGEWKGVTPKVRVSTAIGILYDMPRYYHSTFELQNDCCMSRPKVLLLLTLTIGSLLSASAQQILIRDVNVIDGTGAPVATHQNVLIREDRIVNITSAMMKLPDGTQVIDGKGKTLMPLLINTHGHLGLLKDTTMSSANYTPENIRRHLMRFLDYGVGAVLCMGTDHKEIYGMRQDSRAGILPGATIYTAGMGFGVKDVAPPLSFGMDKVYRPETPQEARKDVKRLASDKPDVIKIWVDDFYGKVPKMKPEIYRAIIDEARRKDIRVAAHLYYLSDARLLVQAGLDIMAHSIRDSVIDDGLLGEMKAHHVSYIPTLSLDEFAYSYEGDPEWINDSFFKASLEPGVYDLITSTAYKARVKNNPGTPKEIAALQIAMKNLKKIYDAGIMITMGTDAGAQPVRAMGFSEHMELQLMVKAGIPPLQAIKIATQNGAILLRADDDIGTLQPDKKANFIMLNANPADNILNTRKIYQVWKDGKPVEQQ
jgi:imidazolonepropionase-like amidohydrolase